MTAEPTADFSTVLVGDSTIQPRYPVCFDCFAGEKGMPSINSRLEAEERI